MCFVQRRAFSVPVSYTHLDVYKRQGAARAQHTLTGGQAETDGDIVLVEFLRLHHDDVGGGQLDARQGVVGLLSLIHI